MQVTTSVTLPEEILNDIDRLDTDRSAFLERAARQYLAQLANSSRSAQDTSDIEKYELYASRLNDEAEDVLEYQALAE